MRFLNKKHWNKIFFKIAKFYSGGLKNGVHSYFSHIMKLPVFLYFMRFFFIFVQKYLIFLPRFLKNICRNATKKEFCKNHVWFLSYVQFSDFKCKKYALLKLVFWGQGPKIDFGDNHRYSYFLCIFIGYESPLCLGGVHGILSGLPDYNKRMPKPSLYIKFCYTSWS